jgi:hypothetical protein
MKKVGGFIPLGDGKRKLVRFPVPWIWRGESYSNSAELPRIERISPAVLKTQSTSTPPIVTQETRENMAIWLPKNHLSRPVTSSLLKHLTY